MATATFCETNPGQATFNTMYPFYVRFINIGIGGTQDSLVPPIGIAIVGVNNYIL